MAKSKSKQSNIRNAIAQLLKKIALHVDVGDSVVRRKQRRGGVLRVTGRDTDGPGAGGAGEGTSTFIDHTSNCGKKSDNKWPNRNLINYQ